MGFEIRVDIEVERYPTGLKRRSVRRSVRRTYAAFLQNAGFFFRVDSQGLHPGLVCVAPLGHGIRNTVDGPGIGTADRSGNVVEAWDRDRVRGPIPET
jgi:hypothetical protein